MPASSSNLLDELHHLSAVHRSLQFMSIHIRRPPHYTVHRAATVPPSVPRSCRMRASIRFGTVRPCHELATRAALLDTPTFLDCCSAIPGATSAPVSVIVKLAAVSLACGSPKRYARRANSPIVCRTLNLNPTGRFWSVACSSNPPGVVRRHSAPPARWRATNVPSWHRTFAMND